jgi:hypothetical protein
MTLNEKKLPQQQKKLEESCKWAEKEANKSEIMSATNANLSSFLSFSPSFLLQTFSSYGWPENYKEHC